MPGHAVHIELASRSRDRFPEGETVTNALYQGVLAPDMGMFPGGDPLLTDLAHHVKTVDLARSLVEHASNDVERAYAWGWISHILADVGLHPAINRAAGDVSWEESREPHMKVEFGLDFTRLAQAGWLRRIRLRHMAGLGFVADAYRDTYGLEVDPLDLRRAQRMVTLGQRLLFTVGTRVGRIAPIRWLGSRFRDTVVSAICNPDEPEPWLLEELALAMEELPRRLATLLEEGLAGMQNVDLDTGALTDESSRSAGRTLRALGERLALRDR